MEKQVEIIKLQDLQKMLGFGKTKMTELLQAGVLPVVKIGRDYITTKEEVAEWIKENSGKEIFFK